jgi:CHAT domain-containing protein
VDGTTLAARVHRFREALATRDLAFVAEARALYADLLGPAAEACKGKTRLILVPDGALWELPFQALQTPSRRYLIEEAAVAYAPSLTFLYERRTRARERTMSVDRPVDRPLDLLALGNPTLGPAEASTFPSLPHAEDQVRRIAALYPAERATTLVGAAADEARVKRDAGRYRILHFATHGVLDDGNPLYSALLLSGRAGDGDGANQAGGAGEDGRLEARELMDIPLAADLVVLSACETARGRIGAGEGVLGLSWAILLAGSTSTVVSQWKVDDETTSQLMIGLHRHLRRTRAAPAARGAGDVAGALRGAALQVMRDGRYRHPYYWASFRVVGAAK